MNTALSERTEGALLLGPGILGVDTCPTLSLAYVLSVHAEFHLLRLVAEREEQTLHGSFMVALTTVLSMSGVAVRGQTESWLPVLVSHGAWCSFQPKLGENTRIYSVVRHVIRETKQQQ